MNLYEQMAAMNKDRHIREVLLDVAKEENFKGKAKEYQVRQILGAIEELEEEK